MKERKYKWKTKGRKKTTKFALLPRLSNPCRLKKQPRPPQERETRAVERTQRAELRAYERQKQRQTREQQRLTGTEIHDDGEGTATTTRPRPFWLTASSALSKSLLRGQPTNPLDKNSGSTSLGGQQTNRLDVGKSGSKSLLGQPIIHLDIDKKTGAGGADARGESWLEIGSSNTISGRPSVSDGWKQKN